MAVIANCAFSVLLYLIAAQVGLCWQGPRLAFMKLDRMHAAGRWSL